MTPHHILRKFLFAILFIFLGVGSATATDPMATKYTSTQCQGSLTPYPTNVADIITPDSLVAVHIDHVGRHGSRFPASAASCKTLHQALLHSDSLGLLTPTGRELLALTEQAMAASQGRWGALDSLGMAEQRSIATRMVRRYGDLFKDGARVRALSSYSPRSMMSMFCFLHQMSRMNNRLEISSNSGRQNSTLVRPFDTNEDYKYFRSDRLWEPTYTAYFEQYCPLTAITRVLGRDYPFGGTEQARELAITEYYVIAGMAAMEIDCDASRFFTEAEYNALWSCFNLRQYLQYTASTVSSVPADMAGTLLMDIIRTTDLATDSRSADGVVADLRFGHAESLMPLLSLLRLPGCYYITNYFDTVAMHWRDFEVVPMAANLQIVLFKAKRSGRYYVRFDVNEKPVSLPGDRMGMYVPWDVARDYMMRCVPLYLN